MLLTATLGAIRDSVLSAAFSEHVRLIGRLGPTYRVTPISEFSKAQCCIVADCRLCQRTYAVKLFVLAMIGCDIPHISVPCSLLHMSTKRTESRIECIERKRPSLTASEDRKQRHADQPLGLCISFGVCTRNPKHDFLASRTRIKHGAMQRLMVA